MDYTSGYNRWTIAIRPGAELGQQAERDWQSGCVVFRGIEIKIPNDLSQPVAREPLIEQVKEIFGSLTEEHVKKLAEISGPR